MSLFGRLFGRTPLPEPALDLTDGAEEEGWVDCAFEASRRGSRIEARARYDGEVVGFSVGLPAEWEPVSFGPDVPLAAFRGRVALHSSGAESDRFVRALAARYGEPAPAARMAARVICTGITLEGDPRALDRGRVRIKLFFAEDDEARYAEAYLNLTLPARRLEFNEKDEDYRANLLRALTGG